jgi:Glyoxalase/Bleomycin resistance protein/Dioxygenase superfamily
MDALLGAVWLYPTVGDIEAEVERLSARGVDFAPGSQRKPFGLIAESRDPDGHELFLWQVPDEGTEAYEHVRPLVEHHAKLVSALDV